jgi:intracellular sulfur oxidation DsrE/DsrF family protein
MADDNTCENGPVILHASDDGSDVARGLALASDMLHDSDCADRVLLVVNHTAIEGIRALNGADIPEGLTVVACAKAMRTHGIPASALDPRISVVPSGIVFLAQQQRSHGWYIRL